MSHSLIFANFSGLRNLDSLGLAHNHLKEIPSRVFSHLTFLNSLELEGNTITNIDPEAFYGLEGKKTIFVKMCLFLKHCDTKSSKKPCTKCIRKFKLLLKTQISYVSVK